MSETGEFAQFDKISFVRDYEAVSIPSGTRITIKQGTAGSITQALGDTSRSASPPVLSSGYRSVIARY